MRHGLLLAMLSLGLLGCSADGARRAGYETLQSYQRNQCLSDPQQECPDERQSYDAYQRKRDSLQPTEPTP